MNTSRQWRSFRTQGERNVLFHRDFRGFSGGHLKVWDYFTHVDSSPSHVPHVYFSKETVWDDSNPWFRFKGRRAQVHVFPAAWPPIPPDALFLAGMDWLILGSERRERSVVPIINLIQHVTHASPTHPMYAFLKHKAIRVCVSAEVSDAISGTGLVNGPVFVIPNGIGLQGLPTGLEDSARNLDLLVVALKQRRLGQQLAERLAQRRDLLRLKILTSQLPRKEFLTELSRAAVTVFLPNRREGFYLPALEGMALGTVVVCPDCVGNRSVCLPDSNCLRPDYSFDSIVAAVEDALRLPPANREMMVGRARETAARHELVSERKAFLDLLSDVDQLW